MWCSVVWFNLRQWAPFVCLLTLWVMIQHCRFWGITGKTELWKRNGKKERKRQGKCFPFLPDVYCLTWMIFNYHMKINSWNSPQTGMETKGCQSLFDETTFTFPRDLEWIWPCAYKDLLGSNPCFAKGWGDCVNWELKEVMCNTNARGPYRYTVYMLVCLTQSLCLFLKISGEKKKMISCVPDDECHAGFHTA